MLPSCEGLGPARETLELGRGARLAENLRPALLRDKMLCDAIATGSNGIVSVSVEERVATVSEKEWRPVNPWYGGLSHRLEWDLRLRSEG